MTAPDRLSLIESRWREAGSGDGEVAWLIGQVKQERRHALWVERRCWRTIPLLGAIGHLQARIEAAEEERNAAEAEVKRLRNYLQEISIGRGAYSRDPLQHADNCIRDMKAEAVKGLKGEPWEER